MSAASAIAERLLVARDGDVAIWTIHRPEARNALDSHTFAALEKALRAAARDKKLRAAVLTGSRSTFVSGGDLRELRTATKRADGARLADAGRRVCDAIARLPVPVIAALPGAAIGGGAELAIACDMRVADPRAKLSFKHARMGVTTAWGLLPRLVALVGHGNASRLLLAGHEVDAVEAQRIGLIEAVSADGQSLATAIAWGRDVARAAPGAVAGLKALLRETTAAKPGARTRERTRFIAGWTGPDHSEAIEAFFGARPPAWVR